MGLSVAAAALGAGIGLCSLSFLAYLFYSGTYDYQYVLLPKIDAELAFSALSGETTARLIFTWGSLLLAVLLTLVLRRFASPATPSKSGVLLHQMKRALAWQVPPRAFFAGWCGGLSVAEGFGILAWLGLNACWLGSGLQSVFGEGTSTWDERLQMTAKLLGQMIAPNMMLLFLPIPHTNVITWLTGTSRNRLIRFHRWLGHGTLWIVTLHSILFYIYWGLENSFWVNFKAWNDEGNVNNLAGSLAFFCALALWVTSLNFVRRHLYEFFFRCHLIFFVGFFLLSSAHYASSWTFFAPGLLLYAADLALRAGQMSNITTVTAATVDEDAGMATLLVKTDQALKHRPLTEVWLLLPGLSRWQWHPFSVASGGGRHIKLHIKKYGRFTKALLAALRQRKSLAVRLSGPMGNEVTTDCRLTPPEAWQQYDVMVMVCGGVGATAMLSILRAMAAQRARDGAASADQGQAGLPRRVICVWTARQIAEFQALDAPLILAATARGGWLTLLLHYTGGGGAAALTSSPESSYISKNSSFYSHSSSAHSSSINVHAGNSYPGTSPEPVYMRGVSAYFWNLLRPAQPLTFGCLQLAAVFVLTYFGAFCGVLLGSSYLEEVDAQWKGGMVISVLLSAMALGLPFVLFIFPIHAFRYWRSVRVASREGSVSEEQVAVPYAEQALLEDKACIVEKDRVLVPGEGIALQVHRGRPDVASLLRAAALETGEDTVGVYAGGPAGMMKTVHLSVCQLNAQRGGAHYELHNESVEL